MYTGCRHGSTWMPDMDSSCHDFSIEMLWDRADRHSQPSVKAWHGGCCMYAS